MQGFTTFAKLGGVSRQCHAGPAQQTGTGSLFFRKHGPAAGRALAPRLSAAALSWLALQLSCCAPVPQSPVRATARNPRRVPRCQSVPIGTVGAQTLQACEAACFRPPTAASRGVYRCTRCTHAYDPRTDGGPNRTRFEDLPDSWSCPTCGAPKSAYARQVAADGSFVWAHDDHDDE